MNYKLHFFNLETGYNTEQIYPTIQLCLDAVTELMFTASHKYVITISTISNL